MLTNDFEDSQGSVKGYVKRIRFQSEDSDFCIFVVEDENSFLDVTCTGNANSVYVGAYIQASGNFIYHPKFGKQLKITSYTESMPSDAQGVEKYLSSGIVSGIGIKTAQKIVGILGKNAIEKIINDPSSLDIIKGLNKKKKENLVKALLQQKKDGETYRFLIEHGLTHTLATAIYKKYEEKSIHVVTKEPFRMCGEIQGIGFLKADGIAKKFGLDPNDPKRIEAGIVYTLDKAKEDGHCYLDEETLNKEALKILNFDNEISLSRYIDNLEVEGKIVNKDKKIFLIEFDIAENFIANYVANKIKQKNTQLISSSYINEIIPRIEGYVDIKYTDEQIEAIKLVNDNKLVLITGGPGCGKTTIVNAIARIFAAGGKTIALCAPTGKAAQRLGAVCNMKAKTIHRLLKYDPKTLSFTYNLQKKLDADVVIIDECSMIDLLLCKDLFSAISNEATIVMVGDKDQLPPVGPGKIYTDLLSINEISKVYLSKVFRRDENSIINDIAFDINEGKMPKIPIPQGEERKDAYFIPKEFPLDAANLVERLVLDQIPSKFNISLDDIQVLSPMNKGPLGTIELNKRLQKVLNPIENIDSEQAITIGDTTFKLNDRVCQKVNDYNLSTGGVFNGDTGVIVEVNKARSSLVVRLWDGKEVEYQKENLQELGLAYAMSVHRSQGSEIPCVVLVLHKCHFNLLERQLIYTAVTRAKKLLIIVGQEEALKIAVSRHLAVKRNCMLVERINNLLV